MGAVRASDHAAPCTAVRHPRPGVPDAAYDCERTGALVQHHLKDGAAAGGEQLAGHEQFGHPPLTGAVGHPPLGPVAAAQPVALGGPFLVAARAGHDDDDEFRIEPWEPGNGEPPAPGTFGMTMRIPKPSATKDAHAWPADLRKSCRVVSG